MKDWVCTGMILIAFMLGYVYADDHRISNDQALRAAYQQGLREGYNKGYDKGLHVPSMECI